MRDIIFYTAIFGDKDNLISLPVGFSAEAICFTDNRNLKSDQFKIIYTDPILPSSHMTSRIYKLLPHKFFPDYEKSVWIDANVHMKTRDYVPHISEYLENGSIAFYKHPERNCIYDEAECCIKWNLDEPSVLREQIAFYESQDYPRQNGLFAGTIIARRHNDPHIKEFGELWWSHLQRFSRRDQISLMYVLKELKLSPRIIEENIWENKYTRVLAHKK